jgi:hypothetical protein
MDLAIVETDNGGDFIKKSKDLETIEGFQNMPYLGMFGGNVKASTTNKRLANEQAFDFWGNSLLKNEVSIQFNSLTERRIFDTPLTSAGRMIIEQAVKEDLKFMQPFAKVAVVVSIIATDKLLIAIRLQEPDNFQQKDFIFLWDATRRELDGEVLNSSLPSVILSGFDYTLDFDIE